MGRKRRYAQIRIYEYNELMPEYHEREIRSFKWIIPVVIVFAVLAAIWIWGACLKVGNVIYPNVRVAGVNVGGMTVTTAHKVIEDAVSENYEEQVLQVVLPDRTIYFDPARVNVSVNAEVAAYKALKYGRTGNMFKVVTQYLMSTSDIKELNLEDALVLDEQYIRNVIGDAANAGNREPVNSRTSIDADMTRISVHMGTAGRSLNEESLLAEVIKAYQRANFIPIEWNYEKVLYQGVDLRELYKNLKESAHNAYYDEENKVVVREASGYTFAVNDAEYRMNQAEDGTIIEIPLVQLKPSVTYGKLTYRMFGQKLVEKITQCTNDPNRNKNLRLACEAINGTILNPDDVFSFNEIVGALTEDKGYGYSTFGKNGERTDVIGEGVTQVASTLYYAALYMNLPTVVREPHMYTVDYVPLGCDANVSWEEGVDYQFRNNRENPIKLQAKIEDGQCIIAFWGIEENDNYVELSEPVILREWTDPDIEIADMTRQVGYRMLVQTPIPGAEVEVVKKVFSGSGKLLQEELLTSTYESRPSGYIVGTYAESAAPKPAEPAKPAEPKPDNAEVAP